MAGGLSAAPEQETTMLPPDGCAVPRARRIRWTVGLAVASVAALSTVWPLLNEDVIDGLDAAVAALRVAETALDDAAANLDTAAGARRGQDAGTAAPDAMPTAAQRAESAARAAGRASTETRAALTRVRHLRMERSGTFAEAVATVRGLRNATRALMAAVAALREGAEALRDAGAVRAAHRALLAADITLDAAQTVLQATEAALDDERFDAPPPAGLNQAAVGAERSAAAPGRS